MAARTSLPLLLALGTVLLAVPAAGAAEPDPLTGLAAPALLPDVERLLAQERFAQPEEARRLVAALRSAGGHAAAEGLVALLPRREPEVRAAALEALAALGLRAERTGEALRGAARDPDRTVRARAVEALGRLGDGRDVPGLLDLLESEDADLRAAALRALRTLTGMRLPASPMRWVQWWSKAEPRARAELGWAIQEMAIAVDSESDLEPYATAAARGGWTDLLAAREAARSWIHAASPALRAQGFRLVAALRLADLVGDVRSALRFVQEEDAWAATDAARALGIPGEGRQPPAAAQAPTR